MNIAQVAPISESVPPKQYGGSERIVSYLTEELVRLGHDVTLFASGDSTTSAVLQPVCPQATRFEGNPFRRDAFLTLLLERAFGSDGFDVIHSHLDFLGFPFIRRTGTPILTTVHGKLDLPELQTVYAEYAEAPLVSISYSQRRACPDANWKTNIYHGIPHELYGFHPGSGAYLALLGRISPEKGPEAAIHIAARTGLPLRIAAKIDPVDRQYFQTVIKPMIVPPMVEYLGEITDREKDEFLGNAAALLCPFWPEPFGLVLVEALACGTPVIAYSHGSFPEVIDDGVTGFLCRNLDEMVEAVGRIHHIDRRQCRRAFEERFTAERMAQDYLLAYKDLLVEKGRATRYAHPKVMRRRAVPEP